MSWGDMAGWPGWQRNEYTNVRTEVLGMASDLVRGSSGDRPDKDNVVRTAERLMLWLDNARDFSEFELRVSALRQAYKNRGYGAEELQLEQDAAEFYGFLAAEPTTSSVDEVPWYVAEAAEAA